MKLRGDKLAKNYGKSECIGRYDFLGSKGNKKEPQ